MDRLAIKNGDTVHIEETDSESLMITGGKKSSVEKRLETFFGKPIEEIGVVESEEPDWGTPVGEEVW